MKSEALQAIDDFSKQTLLVLGDFILDEYLFGEISRVSREAPVLILRYQTLHSAPGGGANTVANVAALGARVIPVGLVGDDPWGRQLLSLWPQEVDRSHVRAQPRLKTTRKTRVLAGSFHSFRQQVVRIDYEHPFEIDSQQEEQMVESLGKLVPQVHAVIVSDYSLGTLTPRLRQTALELARRYKKVIVVDSRDDPAGYPGATSVTPNITEIEAALRTRIGSDTEKLVDTGFRLLKEWQLQSLLVTRGRLGMSLFEADRVLHIPIYGTDEVVDVTGAGDTVIATFATALATGASHETAARLANIAGGIVVTKRGTATASSRELRQAVEQLDASS